MCVRILSLTKLVKMLITQAVNWLVEIYIVLGSSQPHSHWPWKYATALI